MMEGDSYRDMRADHKQCPSCGQIKHRDEFTKDNSRSGLYAGRADAEPAQTKPRMIGEGLTVTDTTNTNELTEQSEKQQATPSLVELDLRDYFAAKAMQSLISKHGFISDEINFAAEHSYEIADAMLKARENTNDRRDAAPAVQGEPVAYIRQEDFEFLLADDMSEPYGTRQAPVFSRKDCRDPVPLYASPQPPGQDVSALVEALEEVTRRIDSVLAAYRKQGGEQ